MKVVFISDTHSYHDQLKSLKGDMIIHAGDVSKRGSIYEIEDFLNWFKSLDFKHKIFIAGNHDFFFEEAIKYEIQMLIPKGVTYLNDSGVKIDNLNIWGSPIQPWFNNWAFNKMRGEEIKSHWDLIPNNTDILVTHGPPFEILDQTIIGESVGCEDLLEKVSAVKPKIHVFGHIHESYGLLDLNDTKFINASVLDVGYNFSNLPVELSF